MVANRNVCHLMQLLYPLHCPPTPALRSPDPAGDTSQVCCREVRQTSGSTPDTTPTRSGAEQIAIPWPLAGIVSPPSPVPSPGGVTCPVPTGRETAPSPVAASVPNKHKKVTYQIIGPVRRVAIRQRRQANAFNCCQTNGCL